METVNSNDLVKPVDFRVSRVVWKSLVFVPKALFWFSKFAWRIFRPILRIFLTIIAIGFEPACCSCHCKNKKSL